MEHYQRKPRTQEKKSRFRNLLYMSNLAFVSGAPDGTRFSYTIGQMV